MIKTRIFYNLYTPSMPQLNIAGFPKPNLWPTLRFKTTFSNDEHKKSKIHKRFTGEILGFHCWDTWWFPGAQFMLERTSANLSMNHWNVFTKVKRKGLIKEFINYPLFMQTHLQCWTWFAIPISDRYSTGIIIKKLPDRMLELIFTVGANNTERNYINVPRRCSGKKKKVSVFDEGTAAKLSAHLDLPKREKRFSLTKWLFFNKHFPIQIEGIFIWKSWSSWKRKGIA